MYAEYANANPTLVIHPAALGASQGYRFEGDQVQIDCSLRTVLAPADDVRYLLQLWACAAPYAGGAIQGVKIAEARLDPSFGDTQCIGVPASPPAGNASWQVVEVLVAVAGDGAERILDYTNFARPESFQLPRLVGAVGYRFEGQQLRLDVEAVTNPRASDNRSGTLTLELWALDYPYAGGAFSGTQLGSALLGTLDGQAQFSPVAVELPRRPVPEGRHTLALMLREWTPAGYLTRDYCNFPLTVDGEVQQRPEQAAPVAEAPRAESATPAIEAPAVRAPAAKAPAVKAPAIEVPASPAPQAKPAPARSVSKAAKSAARGSTEAGWPEDAHHRINRAGKEALTAVKGVSASLAKAITQARPFSNVDALLAVKGLGAKTLRRILQHLED